MPGTVRHSSVTAFVRCSARPAGGLPSHRQALLGGHRAKFEREKSGRGSSSGFLSCKRTPRLSSGCGDPARSNLDSMYREKACPPGFGADKTRARSPPDQPVQLRPLQVRGRNTHPADPGEPHPALVERHLSAGKAEPVPRLVDHPRLSDPTGPACGGLSRPSWLRFSPSPRASTLECGPEAPNRFSCGADLPLPGANRPEHDDEKPFHRGRSSEGGQDVSAGHSGKGCRSGTVLGRS